MASGGATVTIQRIRDALNRFFPERQFYYRSQGVVRFITLRKPAQMSVVGGLVVLLGWMTFTTIQVVMRNEIIDSKNDRVREVTAAYEALAKASADSERRFLTIAGEVEAQHRQLVALVDYRSRLERDIQDLHAVLDRTTGERDQARAATNDLQGRVQSVEHQMAAAVANADAMGRQMVEAKRMADAFAAGRDAVMGENRGIAAQVSELTAALRVAVAGEEQATTQLAEVRGKATQLSRERDAALLRGADLDRQVADLAVRNSATTAKTTDLLRDLGRAEDQAVKVTTERDEAARSRDFMAQLVDELQYRLAGLKESQFDLVARLRDRADANIGMAENVIKRTGLDLDKVLDNLPAGDAVAGIGGPYIPLTYGGRAAVEVQDEFFHAVMAVEQQLDRWNGMELLLTALPLTAPTENFTLSSPFGNRIDPFTRKPAFHEGLDFAGPLNTPIRAPAPGIVTRVGYWGSYGLMVEIDHGFGVTTRYGHLAKATVKKGQTLAFRQDIGTMGRSGRTTGPHLHYEVLFDGEPMDPANFLKAGRNVFKNGD